MARHRRPLFWEIEIANEVRKSGTRLEPIIYRDARLARHLEDFCL
jgi:hypothetical protein